MNYDVVNHSMRIIIESLLKNLLNSTNRLNFLSSRFVLGLVMISALMIITSIAMLAFPKQLRGNRIPATHQVDTIDAHKSAANKLEQQPEEESIPQLKGTFFIRSKKKKLILTKIDRSFAMLTFLL